MRVVPRWHPWSIATKLPLGIGLLLVALLGGMTWAAYAEVRRSNLTIASERSCSLSAQFADLFEVSAQQRFTALQRLATEPGIAECLHAHDATTCEVARLALERHASTAPLVRSMEVWDPDGTRFLTQGHEYPPLAEAQARSLASSVNTSDRAALGEFTLVDDAILYRVVAPIGEPGRNAGYLSEVWRVVGSQQTLQQLSELLGSHARLLVGTKNGVWHDFESVIPAPPVELLDGRPTLEYTNEDGLAVLACAAPIVGSPWFVATELPLEPVLRPAHRFLRRALLLSAVFVAAGVAVGWLFSRRLTRPLGIVTSAAETLAAGVAPPASTHSRRRDELGRLQSSFDAMAREVYGSRLRLQRLADHYQLLFDASPLPMSVHATATGRFLQVNAAAMRHYGYSRDEFLALGVADIAVSSERNPSQPDDARSKSRIEQHRLRSGRVIDVEVTQQTLQYDDQPAMLSVAHDVTDRLAADRWLRESEAALQQLNDALRERMRERSAAEAALRESEQNLATTLDSIGDAVIATDVQGRIVRMNPVAERLTNWSASEARGQPLTEVFRVIDEDTRAPVDSPVERVLRENVIVGLSNHLSLVSRNGEVRPIADSGAPIRDAHGNLLGIVLVFRDMTAERSAERALRDKEARKSAVLEAALDCIITMDHRGRIVEFNPAAERTFGYSQADVIGDSLADLIVPAGLGDRYHAGLQRYLTSGKSRVLGQRIEMNARRADGREFPAEISVVRIGHEDPPLFTGFIRDLTQHKQLEAQLRQAQKTEAIGRLAGGVAHDFNNLISVVLGYCELLMAETEGRRELDEIKAASLRAADLTRQLLAFSRQQVLEPRTIHLDAVVTGMERMLRRLIGEDIDLSIHADSGAGLVYADPGQVEQIIMNLVINARDAMPYGGKLTIEVRDVELDDDYAASHPEAKPGSFVMLAVSDTGVGMDAATQARIFEPFFTTKEKGKGTGLGLSTVLGIVQQSGGSVWVYSELGKGTTFKVYLPRAEAPVLMPTARGSFADASTARGEETILLVEDDDSVRALVRRMLEKLGYAVLEAAGGEQALALCREHAAHIDLVLTDVVMPKVSGRELVERLRKLRSDFKVLFMSGYTDDAIIQHGVLELGVAFVQKPFTPPTLAKKVREALESPAL